MPTPVNIVYPINGDTYPITTPPVPPGSAAFAEVTASFSATRPVGVPNGPHNVTWDFDGVAVGGANFFDQVTVQFVYQLAAGPHQFTVNAPWASDTVSFSVA
jgi:hypothetical protein